MQIRPTTNSTDKRFYNPDRDIAYLGSHLLAKAVSSVTSENLSPWQKELLSKYGLSQNDLCNAAARFVDAFDLLMKAPSDYPDIAAAFQKSGYFDTPKAAQHIIEAKIGQYTCGAFLHGVKDITVFGEAAPVSAEQLAQASEKTVHAWERAKVVKWIRRFFGLS